MSFAFLDAKVARGICQLVRTLKSCTYRRAGRSDRLLVFAEKEAGVDGSAYYALFPLLYCRMFEEAPAHTGVHGLRGLRHPRQ